MKNCPRDVFLTCELFGVFRMGRRQSITIALLALSVFFVGFEIRVGHSQDDLGSQLSGVESSDLFAVEDDEPLELDDSALTRLLFRSAAVSRDAMFQSAAHTAEVGVDAIKIEPQDHRFWVFQRPAIVQSMAKHQLPEELASPELSQYWLLKAVVEGETCLIVSKEVPGTWAKLKTLNEPIEFAGFFLGLKSLAAVIGQPESVPVFVCNRVRWFPNQLSDEIGASHLLLAQHGVDLGSLAVLRSYHGRRLVAKESEFFNQFIVAAKAIGESPSQLGDIQPVGFFDLFRSWKKSTGRVVELEGIVRRVLPVAIDADQQRKLGVKQLYEVDLFVPLDQKIEVHGEIFKSRFPVTVQFSKLPGAPADLKGKRLRVKGFFYRFWSFQSEGSKQAGTGSRLAPLVIGFESAVIKSSTGQVDFLLTSAAILFAIIVVAAIWIFRRSDQRGDNAIQKRKESLPDQIDLGP